MKKTVVIDARMVGEFPHGIARYVLEIAHGIQQIAKYQQLSYHPVFLIRSNLQKEQIEKFSPFEVVQLYSPFLHPQEILEIPQVLKKFNAALYHSPSFSSLWNCPCPSILTLHDLNHLKYGNWKSKFYYRTILRRFARKSKMILTVSEFSKNEISNWLRISPEKIQVIYNSVGYLKNTLNPKQEESSSFKAPSILFKNSLNTQAYFYCLSNAKSHKNLDTLILAYQNYRNQTPEPWPLVISTDHYKGIPGVISLGSLNESDAILLLKNASAMFFPSEYEGFGLPPLEAALLGIPLAVSLIPPHQEGLQDLSSNEVHWVHPHNLQGWTDAFRQIQNGTILPLDQNRLAIRQQKILDRFSTERLGQCIDQIYRCMLKQEK